jgi:hypothetical protein
MFLPALPQVIQVRELYYCLWDLVFARAHLLTNPIGHSRVRCAQSKIETISRDRGVSFSVIPVRGA